MQRLQQSKHFLTIIEHRGLGHLEFQPLGWQSTFAQRGTHGFSKTMIAELVWGYVDGNCGVATPGRSITASLVQSPLAQGNDQVTLFCNRNERTGRDPAAPWMVPSCKCLEADDAACFQINLWL